MENIDRDTGGHTYPSSRLSQYRFYTKFIINQNKITRVKFLHFVRVKEVQN